MTLFTRKGFIAALILAVVVICFSLFDTGNAEFWIFEILVSFPIAALIISCPVITGMKGKYGLLASGLFIHPCWVFGAIRLAKPDSHWAQRFYGPEKMNLARIRFTPDTLRVT